MITFIKTLLNLLIFPIAFGTDQAYIKILVNENNITEQKTEKKSLSEIFLPKITNGLKIFVYKNDSYVGSINSTISIKNSDRIKIIFEDKGPFAKMEFVIEKNEHSFQPSELYYTYYDCFRFPILEEPNLLSVNFEAFGILLNYSIHFHDGEDLLLKETELHDLLKNTLNYLSERHTTWNHDDSKSVLFIRLPKPPRSNRSCDMFKSFSFNHYNSKHFFNLKIESTPESAETFVNGIYYGKTPLELKIIYNDKYKISINKDGYETYYKEFSYNRSDESRRPQLIKVTMKQILTNAKNQDGNP